MNLAISKGLGSSLKNVVYYLIITFLIFGARGSFATTELVVAFDSLSADCSIPTYRVGGKNVSSQRRSDGKIIINGIQDATHYEIINDASIPFDFKEASELEPGQNVVEIAGLGNPTQDVAYKIRLYNGSDFCYTDQSVHLAHINYAEDLDYTELEVVQGVDNPEPQIGDIVTFTTIIQNNGSRPATNVELKQFYTSSMELVYFFADVGEFSPIGNVWVVGDLPAGRQPKLVVRARITAQGLSYLTSYLAKANDHKLIYGQPLPTQDNSIAIAATNCVSVPIEIKKDEVYKVTLQNYAGLTWYYKDAAGNFSSINEFTNPNIAEVLKDSSLSIKQSGEYTYTKTVGKCTFNSCCSVVIQGCKGPTIIVDSVYCNTNVDSYSMVVHLQNDNWSIVEKVYYALSNLSFPVLTNFLRRLNILPLTSSAGYVTSLGGGYYRIENVPAFMPNVTLVSTDMSGECRNVKIVNAPNCQQAIVAQPLLASALQYYTPSSSMPALKVAKPPKRHKTVWYADELGNQEISKGNTFVPDDIGTYYVAYVNKRTKARSALVEGEIRNLVNTLPGGFIDVSLCNCNNPQMIPHGRDETYTVATIYPNPVDQLLNIEYSVPRKSQSADMFVFNIVGNQMGSYILEVNKANKSINVSRWPDGLYLMTMVVDGEKKLTNRFIIRH
ncbi:MAG: putative repeat protein (TIGR01451 family) [Arcticibacterium sp.]|jgi:uncharacterized repeat protein (TIGR01451 family)